jgi:hypothetical protein
MTSNKSIGSLDGHRTFGIGGLLELQRQAVAVEHVGYYFTDVVDASGGGQGSGDATTNINEILKVIIGDLQERLVALQVPGPFSVLFSRIVFHVYRCRFLPYPTET